MAGATATQILHVLNQILMNLGIQEVVMSYEAANRPASKTGPVILRALLFMIVVLTKDV